MNIKQFCKNNPLVTIIAISLIGFSIISAYLENSEMRELQKKAVMLNSNKESIDNKTRMDIINYFKLENVDYINSDWNYEISSNEGQNTASAFNNSTNTVKVVVDSSNFSEHFFSLAIIKLKDDSKVGTSTTINITQGRLPCWDEEESCYINVIASNGNNKRFSLSKGEGFKTMNINESESFIQLIRSSPNIKIEIPFTFQKMKDAGYVELATFNFKTDGLLWKDSTRESNLK